MPRPCQLTSSVLSATFQSHGIGGLPPRLPQAACGLGMLPNEQKPEGLPWLLPWAEETQPLVPTACLLFITLQ